MLPGLLLLYYGPIQCSRHRGHLLMLCAPFWCSEGALPLGMLGCRIQHCCFWGTLLCQSFECWDHWWLAEPCDLLPWELNLLSFTSRRVVSKCLKALSLFPSSTSIIGWSISLQLTTMTLWMPSAAPEAPSAWLPWAWCSLMIFSRT